MKYGPRAVLMKTSQCAARAAEIYPRVIRLMDEAGVPVMDRQLVGLLLVEALGIGTEDDEPTVQRIN